MTVRSHHDLIVWQKAMDLVELVYELTRGFPPDERYRLTDQLCRAIVSVPANIAEGHERSTAKDYRQFLAVSKGSLMEAETHLLIAVRLGYITRESAEPVFGLITEVNKMLSSLRRRLATSS